MRDRSLLDKVDQLKQYAEVKSYESKMKPMSNSAYASMLNEAEEDYERGRATSQEELKQESREW